MGKTVLVCLLLSPLFLITSCNKNSEGEEGDGDSPLKTAGEYVVFAWNDLGMHCLNPSYDELVILPPYNNVNVQVVKRGNPPSVITNGITVEYNLVNNTTSSNKRAYGGFWTYFTALFGGTAPAKDIGLTGSALAGTMKLKTDHFMAEGIPVVPVDDSNTWDPLQVMEVKVKDSGGKLLVSTQTAVPTSDEINCARCHAASGGTTSFGEILKKHDASEGTKLANQKPVLCAKCHGSPALGMNTPGSSGKYLSEVIHGAHASKNASCYDCHPGATTKCSRSLAHMGTAGDGNCITCHGSMANVASTIKSGRVPWVTEPKCANCHTGVTGVDSGTDLYRNAKGHGNIYCTGCHGSPHAMFPSRESKDNYQPKQFQGTKIKTIGSCGICHGNSRGEGSGGEFNSTHGGTSPEHKNACHVCHTVVPGNTASWPHAFTWKNSN